MVDSIAVAGDLLRQLHEGLIQVEEVLATLEELLDREGRRRTKKAEEEYRKGGYIAVEDYEELKEGLK